MTPSTDDVSRKIIEYPLEHVRVLGPPGSGKTKALIERYRSLAGAGHAGGIFVLTYSRENAERLAESVIEPGTAGMGLSPVLNYAALAGEMLAAAGVRKPKTLTSLDEHLLLDCVVERHAKDLRSDFRAIHSSLGFREGLLDVFHVLLQNNVLGEAIARLSDATTGARLADVLLLYRRFEQELRRRNFVTHYDIASAAAAAWRERSLAHPLERAAVLLIDDFQDVDAGQFALIRAIAPPDGPVAVNVFGDPMGPVFGFRGTDDRFLREDFPSLYGCDTLRLPARCIDRDALEGTFTRLLQEVLGEESGKFLPPEHSGGRDDLAELGGLFANVTKAAVSLEITNDEIEEVQNAAARIAGMIEGGSREIGDIAVMANDKSRYVPLIEAAFERYGVPIATGRVRHTAFANFVRAILDLVDNADDDIAIRSVVTSPLFVHLDKTCLDYQGETLDRRRRYEAVRDFAGRLSKHAKAVAATGWMQRIVDRCLRPVCESGHVVESDETPWAFLSRLMDGWEQYASTAAGLGRPVRIGRFLDLSELFASRPGGVTAARDKAAFLSFREANGITRPVAIVLGCAELLVPSVKRREGIMPVDSLQASFDRVYGDPKIRVYAARRPRDHLREELHLLYIALSRATAELYLSAPRAIGGEDLPAPSAVLGETLAEGVRREPDRDALVSPPVRFARSWVDAAPSESVRRRLAPASPVGALWNEPVPEQGVVELEPFPLSKSAIETFLACERRFFYSKVLRIPEDDSPPLKVGQLFHDLMATLSRKYSSRTALEKELGDDEIRDAIDRLIGRDDGLAQQKFFVQTLRHHLALMVKAAIALEKTVGDSYEIEGIEEKSGFEYKGWKFTGRYDRVDNSTVEGARLVDYKTGEFKKRGVTLRERTLDALDNKVRANWQVPLYAWGYKVNKGRIPDTFKHVVVKAGEDPFFVTLFLRDDFGDVPAAATARGRDYQAYSYLLSGDLEAIMDEAVKVAENIFAPRSHYKRTTVLKNCQHCSFRWLCNREQQ